MAEVTIPDSQQPELDHEMLNIDNEAAFDVSDKLEIVSEMKKKCAASVF
jgi:uncharacterized membrane-anchored protein YitT (DUF2179 family)